MDFGKMEFGLVISICPSAYLFFDLVPLPRTVKTGGEHLWRRSEGILAIALQSFLTPPKRGNRIARLLAVSLRKY